MDKETRTIISLILREVSRAEKKHPYWTDDIIHASAIVCEESGELIRAAIQVTYEGGKIDSVKKETIQTAATCIRLLKNI